MSPLDVILSLSIIGIVFWAIEYLTADTKEKYMTWEELVEQMKKEREEDENKRTKKNSK